MKLGVSALTSARLIHAIIVAATVFLIGMAICLATRRINCDNSPGDFSVCHVRSRLGDIHYRLVRRSIHRVWAGGIRISDLVSRKARQSVADQHGSLRSVGRADALCGRDADTTVDRRSLLPSRTNRLAKGLFERSRCHKCHNRQSSRASAREIRSGWLETEPAIRDQDGKCQ